MTSASLPSTAAADRPDTITTACACWLDGAFELAEVSALTGLSESEIGALASDPLFVERVNHVRARPSFGPFVARVKAKRAIKTAVERVEEILADPDASASAIVKTAEFLYAVSQMRSEDGARERGPRPEPFTLRINIAGMAPTIITNVSDANVPAEDELP